MRQADIEILFAEHAAAVHAAVYRLTLDAAAAEDATQEAFVRLLTRPPRDDSNLAAWLKRVAVNFAIDTLRRTNRIKQLGEFEHEALDRPDVSDTTLSDDLKVALSRIKADHRAAVLAVDRDGMSYTDAADLLGVHINKLKTDLLRGRRALHELLKGSALAGNGRKE
ncbi:MAG: sigma-70 family RNA polymerase sigma factor [Planctomycetes bacterium]|nr:sigma-70 family RNA polymerase sigma factor [Planctomycetota bacterium]